jgi:hypothetical protein
VAAGRTGVPTVTAVAAVTGLRGVAVDVGGVIDRDVAVSGEDAAALGQPAVTAVAANPALTSSIPTQTAA